VSGWLGDQTLAHLRDVADWPDLGDRYEIRRRIGRGGMGLVYSAHDRVLDRDVAVKVLDDVGAARDAGRRLLAEAKILGHLEHPGVVPVHDAGILPDGRVFYVMKLVRGERLDHVLPGKSIGERLDLFVRICDAVAFAHAQGIVHRDLKPENVMLGPFGEVLVMDWGVAKLTAASTPDDAIVGTPGYMAPEQERRGTEVDARADVYALGIMLRAMLPDPPPNPLLAIARQASAGDRAVRYATVSALAEDIARFRGGEPVAAYRESVGERMLRLYRRYELPIVLALVYMVVRIVLLLWSGT
jgi:serine/threonine protein kinase